MEDFLKLIIITPDKEFYTGEIVEIVAENEYGHLGILPHHIDMATVLLPSITTFTQKDGKKLKAFTSSGIMNVSNNEVKLLCDASEWPEDIDIKRAEEAKNRAEMRLNKKDGVDFERAEVALMRALMRLKARSI